MRLKLKLTARYTSPQVCTEEFGTVWIELNGSPVLELFASRRPGAEPESEENVVLETIQDALHRLQPVLDRRHYEKEG